MNNSNLNGLKATSVPSKIIVASIALLLYSNANNVIASDIFDPVNKTSPVSNVRSNVQSAQTNPDNSQKKCTNNGRVIKCTGAGTINRDNSGGTLGDISITPLNISATPAPSGGNTSGNTGGSTSYNSPVGGKTGPLNNPITIPGNSEDVSIDGVKLPNQSKLAFTNAPQHDDKIGGGKQINAYAMPPSRCNANPALTRSWQHNISLLDYKGQNAFDLFNMKPGEAMTYKFTVPNNDMSGGFLYNDSSSAGGPIRPVFITITKAPCDFDASKVLPGPKQDSCYQSGINGLGVNWANITGELPAAYCRIQKGATYYMNIRFQDVREGKLAEDSCATDPHKSKVCGGLIQIL